jgi:hypothetical protein
MGKARPAFTIGYGGRQPADFTTLLTENGVKTLVDVRLRPDRANMGVYAKAKEPDKGIAGFLAKAGIGYVSLPELGNLFLDFDDWSERYAKFLARRTAALRPTRSDRGTGVPDVCRKEALRVPPSAHRRSLGDGERLDVHAHRISSRFQ